MLKRLSKRGQLESTKVVNWGIALLVLLALAMAIYFFVLKGEAWGSNIPGAEEAISQGCALDAAGDIEQSYCTQLRKLQSKLYITCDAAKDYGITIGSPKVDSMNNICKTEMEGDLKKKVIRECTDGMFEGDKKMKINGMTCVEWGEDLMCGSEEVGGGVWKDECAADEEDITNMVLDEDDIKANSGKKCCA